MLFRTPTFQEGNIPQVQEIFRGDLEVKAPFKIKLRTRTTNEAGDEVLEVKDVSRFNNYDSLKVYQYARDGQGFIIIWFERINPEGDPDGQTTLITALIPAFNKDDGKEENRKHLERVGIPYIEIPERLGKNTGIGHVTASRWLGFQPESKEDTTPRMGGGLFKKERIAFRSQSQQDKTIFYDEFFLLAHALNFFDKETGYNREFFIRRLIPGDIAVSLTTFLKAEIMRTAKNSAIGSEDYRDDGSWMPTTLEKFTDEKLYYTEMKLWPTMPLERKKTLLFNTFSKAIISGDPSSYSDYRLKSKFTDRILRLNQELELKLNFDSPIDGDLDMSIDGFTLLGLAVQYNNKSILEKLLNQDADIDALDNHGHPPLYYAFQTKDYAMVKLLLAKGASNKSLSEGDESYDSLLCALINKSLDEKDFKTCTLILKDNPELPEKPIKTIHSRIQMYVFNIFNTELKNEDNLEHKKLKTNFPEIYFQIKKFMQKSIPSEDRKLFIEVIYNCVYTEVELLHYQNLKLLEKIYVKANVGPLNIIKMMDPEGEKIFFQNFIKKFQRLKGKDKLLELEKFQLHLPIIFEKFIKYSEGTDFLSSFTKKSHISSLQFMLRHGANFSFDKKENTLPDELSDFLLIAKKCNSLGPSDKLHQAFAMLCDFEAKTSADFMDELLNFKLMVVLTQEIPNFKDTAYGDYTKHKSLAKLNKQLLSVISSDSKVSTKNIEAFYILQNLKGYIKSNFSYFSHPIINKQFDCISEAEETNAWSSALEEVFKLARSHVTFPVMFRNEAIEKYLNLFTSIELLQNALKTRFSESQIITTDETLRPRSPLFP